MKIPKTIKKNNFTFEFVKKIKDNMYLYQEKNLGFNTTFSNFDLGLVKNEEKTNNHIKKYIKAM
jgi:hypothetical protein